MRFDDSNTIVEVSQVLVTLLDALIFLLQVHAYLDSALVEKVAATNS